MHVISLTGKTSVIAVKVAGKVAFWVQSRQIQIIPETNKTK